MDWRKQRFGSAAKTPAQRNFDAMSDAQGIDFAVKYIVDPKQGSTEHSAFRDLMGPSANPLINSFNEPGPAPWSTVLGQNLGLPFGWFPPHMEIQSDGLTVKVGAKKRPDDRPTFQLAEVDPAYVYTRRPFGMGKR